MTAAIIEFTGVDSVSGVVIRQGIGAQHQVSGGKPGISRDIIEIGFTSPQLNAGLGVADIEVSAGGAHGSKGAGSHHVHFLAGPFHTLLSGNIDYFFGGKDYSLAFFDFLVYFLNRLRHIFRMIVLNLTLVNLPLMRVFLHNGVASQKNVILPLPKGAQNVK